MIPVAHGYARVSKPDDATRSPETQHHVLQEFGIREEYIFTGGMTGSSLSRPGWNELMNPVQPNALDTNNCLVGDQHQVYRHTP